MLADRRYNFNVQQAYETLVETTRQYSANSGYTGDFVVGLSGGIDSALVAVIAVEAFGAGRVHGVILPSNTTSEESVELAMKL